MGRRANPHNNAAPESLIKTPKRRSTPWKCETFEDAAADPPRFIDEVCNTTRSHSAPGQLSPARFMEINRPAPVHSAA